MGTFKNPDVWKQNLAYQIGAFVLYNGIVYMAIKPVPAGTAISADYWTEFAEGAIVPTGEISITENGEVNVAQYATANVNVEGGGGGGETYSVSVYEIIDDVPAPSEIKLYVMEWVSAVRVWQPTETEALDVAAGTVIGLGIGAAFYTIWGAAESLEADAPIYFSLDEGIQYFPMPASDVCVILRNNAQ